jgi:2-polyprenyl-3-methyl-5-hydroxy-6-metoxy-1,4-benzoquinol methylase
MDRPRSEPVIGFDFGRMSFFRRVQARNRERALELPALERELTSEGVILDLGCGQGIAALWLAGRFPGATVIGVDLDEEKLQEARRMAGGLSNLQLVRSRFEEFLPSIAPRSVRGVLLADVLSSMPFAEQDELFRRLSQIVAPGGRVVVLYVDTRPRLRATANAFRSYIVCRVLRLTKATGERFFYRSGTVLRSLLESSGFEVVRDEPRAGFAPRRRLVAEKRRS